MSTAYSPSPENTWWMTNEQAMNSRSEHDWTMDVQEVRAQIFVGTHAAPSETHDDDSGVLFIYCGTPPVN